MPLSKEPRTDPTNEQARDDRTILSVRRRRVIQTVGAAGAIGLSGIGGASTVGSQQGGVEAQTARIYEVRQRGADPEQVEALAEELSSRVAANPERFMADSGVIQYLDPDNYMHVPMADAPAQSVEDEDGSREVSMVLDREALEERPEPPNADEMMGLFVETLQETDLHPGENIDVSTDSAHATMGLDDVSNAETVLVKDLDTAVYLRTAIDGIPLTGAGANIRARFTTRGDDVVLSDVRYAFRELEAGREVTLVPPDVANEQYRERLETQLDAESFELMEPRLVYQAPALQRRNDNPVGDGENPVQALIPHYEVGGTAQVEGEEVTLLRETLPAVESDEFVPQVSLSVESEGTEVRGAVSIEGGQQPYKVEWSLSDGFVHGSSDGDPQELIATVRSREPIEEATVFAEVTDANGVSVRRRQTVPIEEDSAASRRVRSPAASGGPATVPGQADVGLESSFWVNYTEGLVRAARESGNSVNHTWTRNQVWEQDFKATTDDDFGADTADLVMELGHGSPKGFWPKNNNHDDGFVSHTDGDGAWGTHDCEWLSLFSCNTLAPDDGKCGRCDGLSRIERWWQEFDGLHQLHGFQTFGHKTGNLPYDYGAAAMGNYFGLALPMRTAWLLAVDNNQPGPSKNQAWKKRGVVMGPMTADRTATINDHFHGEGPVGPDIDHSDVKFIWWIVAGTGGS